MAMMNPFEGVNLPTPQRLTADDFQTTAKALGTAATSVGNYMTEQDNKRADRATAALMEAQNTGDAGYISSIMDYAVNNINDPDKRNTLVNSGRGALENTAVTQFNYKLAQARDSGDPTVLTDLDKDVKTNPLYSPVVRDKLFTLLQTSKPAIEETGLVKDAWTGYQADEQANIDNFKEAAQRARAAITSDPKDSDYFSKLLSPDEQGGYSRVAITPANAADFIGLLPKDRTPEALAGAVNTVREIQAKLFDRYGAELNKGYKLPEDPLVKARKSLTQAMMGRGKDPGAAIAKVVSASAMLQDPNKQASYESTVASNKAAADASKRVIEEKSKFATAFIEAEKAKFIKGNTTPLNLQTALSGITTDWVNLGGYNRKEATEIILEMQDKPQLYGLAKAPTDEELAYAITMSMTTGWGDDQIVKKDSLARVLQIHLKDKPVDPSEAKNVILNSFNTSVANRENLINSVSAREAQANLEAAYRIKGDRGAYLKGFGAVIEANRRQDVAQNVMNSTSKNKKTNPFAQNNPDKIPPIEKVVQQERDLNSLDLVAGEVAASIARNSPVDIKATTTDLQFKVEKYNKDYGESVTLQSLLDKKVKKVIPKAKTVEEAKSALTPRSALNSNLGGTSRLSPNNSKVVTPTSTTSSAPMAAAIAKVETKPLTISDSPTALLKAAKNKGITGYDQQSDGTFKKRYSDVPPLTIKQFVDKLNAEKNK